MKKIGFLLLSIMLILLPEVSFGSSGDMAVSGTVITPKVIVRNGVPLTFRRVSNARGVTLYKHRRENTYVEVIDLARVTFFSTYSYVGQSENGEPTYQKRSLLDHVRTTRLLRPISVLNGQFFDPAQSASPLSFGLKDRGNILTSGADDRGEHKNILTVNADGAEIIPYDATLWQERNDSFAMVNLDPSMARYPEESIGRTFICIPLSEGIPAKKVFVYVTEQKTDAEAKRELEYWGCDPSRTSLLDSSGSSQFWTRDTTLYGFSHRGKPDYRTFPHAIVIASYRR